MYLRCPWSLAVAIGLTAALAILLTATVITGNLGSTVITNVVIVSTALAWNWWRIGVASSAHNTATKQQREGKAEAAVRQIRSQ